MKTKTKLILALALSVPVVAALLLGAFFFLREKRERPPLSSDKMSHDFGRIPIKNGIARATHVFKIYNSLDEPLEIAKIKSPCGCLTHSYFTQIPARGEQELHATMTFEAGSLSKRRYAISIIPKRPDIKALEIPVAGMPDFSGYFSRKDIAFGICTSTEEKSEIVDVLFADLSKDENFIREIAFSNKDCLQVETVEKSSVKNRADGTTYFLNRNRLKIKLVEPKTAGRVEDELSITLKSGEILRLPVSWEGRVATVFEPEMVYVLNPKPLEKREFEVFYNAKKGGKIKSIRTSQENLRVAKNTPGESRVHLGLELQLPSSAPASETKLGEIFVETEDGKTHVLAVLVP